MRTGSSTGRRRNSQGGYALLMVFLMAAIVALMLYQQMPRVAFETERDKEQLLVDRGEQYIRAIRLYYLANNRQYPTSIDDLEKKEKRFLRQRYIDPYTGKDEWRIIHTNGGFLTDSLVQKPPAAGDSQSQSASNTNGSTTGGTTPADGQPQVNAAVLQRPSDRPLTPPGFGQPTVVQDPSAQPVNAPNAPLPPITLQAQQGPGALPPITLQAGGNQPGGLPPITLAPVGPAGGPQNPAQGQLRPGAGTNQFPGQPVPGPGGLPGGLPGGIQTGIPPGFQIDASGQLVPVTPVAGQGLAGQPQAIPGQPQGFPGQPGIPGQPFSPQPGQAQNQFPNPQNQPFPNQQFQQAPNPLGGAPGAPTPALNLINQLLTNPRQTSSTPLVTSGNQVGAIAGIASTHKGPSIKVYKDQSQYQMWEFVFSPTASTVPGAVVGGTAVGGPAAPGGIGAPGGTGAAPGAFGGGRATPYQNTFGQGAGPQSFTPAPGR